MARHVPGLPAGSEARKKIKAPWCACQTHRPRSVGEGRTKVGAAQAAWEPPQAGNRHTVGKHVPDPAAAFQPRMDGDGPWFAWQTHRPRSVGEGRTKVGAAEAAGEPPNAADRHTVAWHVPGLPAGSEARKKIKAPWCACQTHRPRSVGEGRNKVGAAQAAWGALLCCRLPYGGQARTWAASRVRGPKEDKSPMVRVPNPSAQVGR